MSLAVSIAVQQAGIAWSASLGLAMFAICVGYCEYPWLLQRTVRWFSFVILSVLLIIMPHLLFKVEAPATAEQAKEISSKISEEHEKTREAVESLKPHKTVIDRFKESASETTAVFSYGHERLPAMIGNCPGPPCYKVSPLKWSIEDRKLLFQVMVFRSQMPVFARVWMDLGENCWSAVTWPDASVRILVEDPAISSLRIWVGLIEHGERNPGLPLLRLIPGACGEESIEKYLDAIDKELRTGDPRLRLGDPPPPLP